MKSSIHPGTIGFLVSMLEEDDSTELIERISLDFMDIPPPKLTSLYTYSSGGQAPYWYYYSLLGECLVGMNYLKTRTLEERYLETTIECDNRLIFTAAKAWLGNIISTLDVTKITVPTSNGIIIHNRVPHMNARHLFNLAHEVMHEFLPMTTSIYVSCAFDILEKFGEPVVPAWQEIFDNSAPQLHDQLTNALRKHPQGVSIIDELEEYLSFTKQFSSYEVGYTLR